MSTSICLPAHILDAQITPRAREVLMMLASQTSAENPALWICQSTIAERLRCSVATVARAIQKLLEEKLIAETGKLHEGRYKFYHVCWSIKEKIKAIAKKITKPIRKIIAKVMPKPTLKPIEAIQLVLPPVTHLEAVPPPALSPPPSGPSTMTPQTILKDSRIAYFAEIARQRHAENLKIHKAMLLAMR
jgi:DNA-binding MarR family transcriptional regulator